MRTCSQLLKKFLMAKFVFVRWIVQVNRQKITVKKKITENYCKIRRKYFLKNYVSSLFTVFENVLAICNFFYRSVFRYKAFRPAVFYLFEVQSTVLLSSEAAIQGVLRNRCSENMHQIYRRTHMLKCDFNNVSLQIYWN